MLLIDLCCGLGGVSSVARERGWQVFTLDIAPIVKPDILGDLKSLPLKRGLRPDLLWISPCCREFSTWQMQWGKAPRPDLSLMRAAVEARNYLNPRFWVIENVPVSVRWCDSFLGQPQLRCWGHVFWTNRFTLLPQVAPHKMRIPGHGKFTHYRRSLMPPGVALSFIAAAERACQARGGTGS